MSCLCNSKNKICVSEQNPAGLLVSTISQAVFLLKQSTLLKIRDLLLPFPNIFSIDENFYKFYIIFHQTQMRIFHKISWMHQDCAQMGRHKWFKKDTQIMEKEE